MNETARRFADVVLPGTAWLEELGFKVTNTHLYLMERILEREGETRPIHEIFKSLAGSLGLADFFPWASMEEVLDAILQSTLKRDSCPVAMRSRLTTSRESSGQRRMSPTTCHQVWSGFAMNGLGSIISHPATRF
jgi:anaerobic selenocysteine-containing dehydrogenase